MRLRVLASFTFVSIIACGASNHAAPASAANLPIAQYLGSDDATGQRVFDLLHAAGIESSAGGSLGYSVWVGESDRDAARRILVAAASTECLPLSVIDDSGVQLAGTRPSRCPSP